MARTTPLPRAYPAIAAVLAGADIALIALGTQAGFPKLLVWVPAVAGPALAVAAFRGAAALTEGPLRTFWRRLAYGMGAVMVAALSQTVDVTTIPYAGMPPIGARTLLLYVIGTVLAISAMLRLPGGGRSWRQLTTAVLDVAVVAVTAGIAASQYVGWFIDRFGVSASAWWLNIAMMAIAVAGVVVVVKIMAASRSPVPRAALWWLAPVGLCGPLSTVLMSLLRPWPHLNGSAAVLPFVGLFGVLAAYAQKRADDTHPALAPYPATQRRGTAVPLVATGLTSLLLVTLFLRTGHLTVVQVAGTTLLLLLVVARQAVALAENGTLLTTVANQAAHDDLTGLFNRRHFTAAVAGARGTHTVVLLDLKEFRELNDALGPDAGDQLLIAYAERLTRLAGSRPIMADRGGSRPDMTDHGGARPNMTHHGGSRPNMTHHGGSRPDMTHHGGSRPDMTHHGGDRPDMTRRGGDRPIVARLGGDEFGLLLPGLKPDFADRLYAANAEPLHAAGHEVLVDVSIGLADGEAGDLYRRAEIALRAAVAAGGRVVRYDASLERRLTQRATVAADLRRALTAGEFHLLYQPIVELPHGRMTGVEALVRWTRADGQVVSPADFIPIAEDTGLIVELGAWILDTVCAQAAVWGPHVLRSVAVNVSARQLLDPGLPDLVATALARHGVPPHQLTIEITETAVFGGGRALATVHALSELGVTIALDDFGTGHSSLGLLRTCPVDAIKVDKSFVDGLGGTPQQEAIVTALTGIAETMGLRTVAEGVERPEQARRLHELGYRYAQGFLFARPLPPADITTMLQQIQHAAA